MFTHLYSKIHEMDVLSVLIVLASFGLFGYCRILLMGASAEGIYLHTASHSIYTVNMGLCLLLGKPATVSVTGSNY